MKQRALLLLLILLIALGIGFLVLVWLDIRSSSPGPGHPPPPVKNYPAAAVRNYPRANRDGSRQSRQEPQLHHSPCEAGPSRCDSLYFASWKWPATGSCRAVLRSGFPEPDPRCTPGGVIPGLTLDDLRSPSWRTGCIRNCQSSEAQKHVTYDWYGLERPQDNYGQNQVCELDHLVPLELGGADGLGNIWPQCGPDLATLHDRFFKQKDIVENYLAARVRAGDIPLDAAQRGIATDWTQYLAEARRTCRGSRC